MHMKYACILSLLCTGHRTFPLKELQIQSTYISTQVIRKYELRDLNTLCLNIHKLERQYEMKNIYHKQRPQKKQSIIYKYESYIQSEL